MSERGVVAYGEYGLFRVTEEYLLDLVPGGTNYVCFGGSSNTACPNVCNVQDLVCPTIGPPPPNVVCGLPSPPQINASLGCYVDLRCSFPDMMCAMCAC